MRTIRVTSAAVALVVTAVVLGGCASMGGGAPQPVAAPSLYERLGGRHAIRLVVDDFVANAVADNRVNARFKDMKAPDVERLKSNLADQICQAAGGPCSYLGRDMKTVHAGMKITEVEWTACSEALVKALDKNKVGSREKDELLGVVASLMKDIVGQ